MTEEKIYFKQDNWSYTGSRFEREVDLKEYPMSEKFRVQHVQVVHLKWKVSGSGTARLLIRRLSCDKLPKHSPTLVLAEYPRDAKSNSGKVEIIQKKEVAFNKDVEFWQHGLAGQAFGFFCNVDKGCTVEVDKLEVKTTVKGFRDMSMNFGEEASDKEFFGKGFGQDTGICCRNAPQDFEVSHVHGTAEWHNYESKDHLTPPLKLKRLRSKKREVASELNITNYACEVEKGSSSFKFKFNIVPTLGDKIKNPFWRPGKKGERFALFCDVGRKGSKIKFKQLYVRATFKAVDRKKSFDKPILRVFICGISKYVVLNELKNPVGDAEAMRKVMKKLGADIYFVTNCHIFEMQEEYGRFLKSVQPGDIALIFFAGHGCRFKNEQCLLARALTPDEKTRMTVESQTIHESSLRVPIMNAEIKKKGAKLVVFLLDCCRNFVSTDLKRDDSESWEETDKQALNPDVPEGTIIGFATSPNDFALDGPAGASASATVQSGSSDDLQDPESKLGYFTAALTKHILTPNVDIDTVLRRVGKEVKMKSKGQQKPYRNSCINDPEAYLVVTES